MARAMADVKVVRRWGRASGGGGTAGELAVATPPGMPAVTPRRVRRVSAAPVRVVAIGTSTGGPAALHRILIDLPRDFGVPILVVQHIARGFVGGLVSWLGANCALRVTVAADGEPLVPGTVYLAPDDHHIGATPDGRARLIDSAPVGGFRPSADVLFDSVARAYGASTTALILTGMGRDGVEGLAAIRSAGGRVLAQDEGTSVVFGMAREAIAAGVVDEVLPLQALAPRLLELVPPGTERTPA
jgi:two-component system chemotaxis response regulator CheB